MKLITESLGVSINRKTKNRNKIDKEDDQNMWIPIKNKQI